MGMKWKDRAAFFEESTYFKQHFQYFSQSWKKENEQKHNPTKRKIIPTTNKKKDKAKKQTIFKK